MNKYKLAAALFFVVTLCGCSRTGLGDKVIVKALLVDYQQEYTAQVLALEPQPSADAGEAAETLRLIEGSGESLMEAIGHAEASSAEELFYGQNELLLLGPGIQQAGITECCRFLYENSAGRPNMAVWGIDIPVTEHPLTEENADTILERIQRLGERGEFHTYLYQLASATDGSLFPLLQLSGQDTVQVKSLVLYQKGRPMHSFTGSAMELASLLSGQSGTGQLEVKTENGPVSLTIRSPKLIYECTEQSDEMQLSIHFTGHVEQMTGELLPVTREGRRALLNQINEQLGQTATAVIQQAFAPDTDLFGFLNRFCNRNERLAKALAANNTLYQSDCVKFSSNLQLL